MAGGQFLFDGDNGGINVTSGLAYTFDRDVTTVDPQTGSPTSGPDEILDITGFGLEESFTLLMAGMMPSDDWNHRTPRSGDYWPLFTLWGDDKNWIEFGAVVSEDPDSGAFRVRMMANGDMLDDFDWPRTNDATLVDDQYWSRNSQLLVGLSWNASTHALSVLASLGGDAPRHIGIATAPAPEFSQSFDLLKFRGAEDEVVSFRWFGGKAISGTALPALGANSMAEQFMSLAFLDEV